MAGEEPFSYYHPINVRYSDLDTHGHVNNAVFLTYLESARLGYYEQVGIWRRDSGMNTGMVVARIEIDYLSPIFLYQLIRVGLRLEHIGTKSFSLAFQIESTQDQIILAQGKSFMVAYDNQANASIEIPADWREKLTRFEEV